MRAFLRPFWLSATLSLALCLLAAHAALIISRQNDVAKPPMPIPGRTYVCSYPRGFADHYLFLFGLFGFGERIHSADVLISGSSHPQLGLSADQLSHRLSEKSGSHVRAFNMSLAFGEGMAFTRDILQRNDIEEKTMIIDVFNPLGDDVSEFGRIASKADLARAYFEVGKIWADFLRDWLFDSVAPRVIIEPQAFGMTARRFLSTVVLRHWKTGDVIELWQPDRGAIYQHTPPDIAHGMLARTEPFTSREDGGIYVAQAMIESLRSLNIKAVFTLIPYPTYDEAAAMRVSQAYGMFISIAPGSLMFLDIAHFNADGRSLATDRLIAGWPAGLPHR